MSPPPRMTLVQCETCAHRATFRTRTTCRHSCMFGRDMTQPCGWWRARSLTLTERVPTRTPEATHEAV